MADFLGKSKDLSKVTLELTFPAVGTHSFLEAKEINVSPSDNAIDMTDPDIKGNVSTIETKVSKREIKITTTKGSDDDAYLVRVLLGMNSKLGTLVYIDDTGDNKIVGIGQGVSVQKGADRKNNTKDIEVEYTIQCAKYNEKVG